MLDSADQILNFTSAHFAAGDRQRHGLMRRRRLFGTAVSAVAGAALPGVVLALTGTAVGVCVPALATLYPSCSRTLFTAASIAPAD